MKGVDWQAVSVISGIVIVLLSAVIIPIIRRAVGSVMGDIIVRQVSPRLDTIDGELNEIRTLVGSLDTRLTRLEGIEEGMEKQRAIDSRRMTQD